MTIKRTVAEKYTVFNEKGFYLATIFLDDVIGEICCQSQYGNYAYDWHIMRRGTPTLKEFLVTAGNDYISYKFGYDSKNDHFFSDKTVDRIKEEILRYRKGKHITSDQAKECFRELEDIEHGCRTSAEFYSQLDEYAPTIMEMIYNNSPYDVPWVTGTHPQLTAFMNEVWPLFIAQIKEELKKT